MCLSFHLNMIYLGIASYSAVKNRSVLEQEWRIADYLKTLSFRKGEEIKDIKLPVKQYPQHSVRALHILNALMRSVTPHLRITFCEWWVIRNA